MIRLYQTEWHGISFKSFAELSTSKIADEIFYSRFYDEFFKNYQSWEDLNKDWVKDKLSIKDFIENQYDQGEKCNILSIGCGLGLIEKALIKDGYKNIEMTEISDKPLQWISKDIDSAKVYVGYFPDCLPHDRLYDVIFFSDIDYCFDKYQLIAFLKSVNKRLVSCGKVLIVTSSFKQSLYKSIVLIIKNFLKIGLGKIGRFQCLQFWGYIRNRTEFHVALQQAGFSEICDGLIDPFYKNYWCQGTKISSEL
jgi:SAM-dependent methyltransferase